MSARRILTKLTHASAAELWSIVSRPRLLLTLPMRPPSQSSVAAVHALMPDLDASEIEARRLEFLNHEALLVDLNRAMVSRRCRRVNYPEWNEFLYVLVRIARPRSFVETGVFDGQSSAIVLQAMEENGEGRLISIDLPAVEAIEGSTHRMRESSLPAGCGPGWLVPDRLRARYELRLGDARSLLPEILADLGIIDVFFHDSMHTYEHMKFEFSTAWPHVAEGGFVLSDDIHWNHSFHEFARSVGRPYVRVQTFGALRR